MKNTNFNTDVTSVRVAQSKNGNPRSHYSKSSTLVTTLSEKERRQRLKRLAMLGILSVPLAACGSDGDDGLTAYQIWLDAGNEGTEQDFIDFLMGDPDQGAPTITFAFDGQDGAYTAQATNASTLIVFDQNGNARFDSIDTVDGATVFGISGLLPTDLETLDLNGLDLIIQSVDGNVYTAFLSTTAITGNGDVTIFASQSSATKVDIQIDGTLTFDMISDDVTVKLSSDSIINVTGDLVIDDGTLDVSAMDEDSLNASNIGGDIVLNSGLIATVDFFDGFEGEIIGIGDLKILLTSVEDVAKFADILANMNVGSDINISFDVQPEFVDDAGLILQELLDNPEMSEALGGKLPDIGQPDGTVLIVSNNVISIYNSLTEALDAAEENDTLYLTEINYELGAYTFDKAITIKGPNAGVHGASEDRGGEAVIKGLFTVNADIHIDGVTLETLDFANGTTFSLLAVPGAWDVTIENSLLLSPGENGNGGTKLIDLDTRTTGEINILDNFLGDPESFQAFSTASITSAIWSDGAEDVLNIQGNVFQAVRTGINLDGYNDENVDVSGNTFLIAGSGITIGKNAITDEGVLEITSITNNTFEGVGTGFNLRNFEDDVSIILDLAESSNIANHPVDGSFISILAGAGDDVITVSDGGWAITGNAGQDAFVFTEDFSGNIVIKEYNPGEEDFIDLTAFGIDGSNAELAVAPEGALIISDKFDGSILIEGVSTDEIIFASNEIA